MTTRYEVEQYPDTLAYFVRDRVTGQVLRTFDSRVPNGGTGLTERDVQRRIDGGYYDAHDYAEQLNAGGARRERAMREGAR